MCRSPPPKSPDNDIREHGEEEDPFKRRKKALVISAVKIERHFYDDVYFFANTRNPERLVLFSLLYTVQLFSPNLIYMRRFEMPHSSVHPPPGSGTGGFECRRRSACGSSTRCPSPPPPRGLRSTGRPPNTIAKNRTFRSTKKYSSKESNFKAGYSEREKSIASTLVSNCESHTHATYITKIVILGIFSTTPIHGAHPGAMRFSLFSSRDLIHPLDIPHASLSMPCLSIYICMHYLKHPARRERRHCIVCCSLQSPCRHRTARASQTVFTFACVVVVGWLRWRHCCCSTSRSSVALRRWRWQRAIV